MATDARRDDYEILGVSHAATAQEIKAAFLRLAAGYQAQGKPANIEAVERFRDIARAFHILSDGEQRSRYDRLGEAGVDPTAVSSGYDPDLFEKWTTDANLWNPVPVNDWPSDFIEYVKNRPVEFIDND